MDRGIYSAATGMVTLQRWQEMTSNNLANVATNGFKRDGLIFNEAFSRELRRDLGEGEAIGEFGSGAVPVRQFTDRTVGSIRRTENELDVALEGPAGMLAVQAPNGIRYTRDGSLQIDAQGRLTTRAGNPVLDVNNRPISLGQGSVTIDASGQVSQNGTVVARLQVAEGSFTKEGANLYTSGDARILPDNDRNRPAVRQGALEGSNVDAVIAMVDLIRIQRNYELAQKSIQQQDDLTQRLIQSVNGRG